MAEELSMEDVFGAPAPMGAPGTTKTDVAEGIRSEVDVAVRKPGVVKAKAVAPTKPAESPSEMSMEDVFGKQKVETKPGHLAKEVVDVADFLTSGPGMVYSHLKDIGTRFGLIAAGAPREEQDSLARQAAADIPEALRAPVTTVLGMMGLHFGSDPTLVSKAMDLVSQGVSKGGAWVEKATGGIVTAAAFDTLLEGQMAAIAGKGTAKGVELVGKKVKGKAPEAAPPEAEAPPTPEPPPSVQPTPGTLFGEDAQINAAKKAHDLVNRNAPLKEVLAARKRNPLVGKIIDEIQQRREQVRGGPMATILQDEVLGPEEARAVVAAEHPQPNDYHNVVAEHADERMLTESALPIAKRPTPGQLAGLVGASGLAMYMAADPDQQTFAQTGLGMVGMAAMTKGMRPEEIMQVLKQANKKTVQQALAEGKVTGEHAFRGTNLNELQHIASTGELRESREFDGIYAASIQDGNFPVYGKGVGMIAPPEAFTSPKGLAQVTLDPKANPRIFKYVLGDKIVDFDGMKAHVERLGMRPGFEKQRGGVDPKLLARLAAIGVGATVGAAVAPGEDKVKGALAGAGIAFGAVAVGQHVSPKGIADFATAMVAEDKRIRVNDIADRREYTIEAAQIHNAKLRADIEKLVPKAERRAAITRWREGDKTVKLTPNEIKAAKIADNFFKWMEVAGKESGVLKHARENYVTHIWDWGLQNKSKIEEALSKRYGAGGMGTKSPYAKERKFETLAEGKEAGLKPKTEDIGEIMEIYGNSMTRAMANDAFMKGLKSAVDLEGKSLLLSADKAPHTYVSVNHPQLSGTRVHPDIAPSVEFLFDSHTPNVASRALEVFNTSLKRLSVSFSLFHNKALLDARIGAATITKPTLAAMAAGAAAGYALAPEEQKTMGLEAGAGAILLMSKGKEIKNFVLNKDAYLKELKEQGVGPNIELALKGGLQIAGSEDMKGRFYDGLKSVQGMLDQTVPGAGLPVKGVIAVNHAVDVLTWSRMHTGMKLNTFMQKYEQILTNNAKAHERSPDKVQLMKPEEAAKIAASFTNDTFGGLNWRLVAEGVKNQWGRDIALWGLKPSSRRFLQLAMFAPDWTLSTVRAFTGAFGKGSGIKGLTEPKTVADLHRQYVLRSAFYYMLVGDAMNQYFTGRHFWENRDKTRVDLGDGRTMQWSKHSMEPIHWMTDPMQQALNKLGIIPRQALEQAQKVEYLSATGKAPAMKGTRAEHLMKGISPISVQQNFDAGTGTGIAGLLGAPIYGKTAGEREAAKMKRKVEAMQSPKAMEERMKRLRGEK